MNEENNNNHLKDDFSIEFKEIDFSDLPFHLRRRLKKLEIKAIQQAREIYIDSQLETFQKAINSRKDIELKRIDIETQKAIKKLKNNHQKMMAEFGSDSETNVLVVTQRELLDLFAQQTEKLINSDLSSALKQELLENLKKTFNDYIKNLSSGLDIQLERLELKDQGNGKNHVFISYVHNDINKINKLKDELESNNIVVWLDREKIMPGMKWQKAIKNAIENGMFFLACFSDNYTRKPKSYMNKELRIAIDQMMEMPEERIWFIPTKISECVIPAFEIGGNQTLEDLHYVNLASDWNNGVKQIVDVIKGKYQSIKDG